MQVAELFGAGLSFVFRLLTFGSVHCFCFHVSFCKTCRLLWQWQGAFAFFHILLRLLVLGVAAVSTLAYCMFLGCCAGSGVRCLFVELLLLLRVSMVGITWLTLSRSMFPHVVFLPLFFPASCAAMVLRVAPPASSSSCYYCCCFLLWLLLFVVVAGLFRGVIVCFAFAALRSLQRRRARRNSTPATTRFYLRGAHVPLFALQRCVRNLLARLAQDMAACKHIACPASGKLAASVESACRAQPVAARRLGLL